MLRPFVQSCNSGPRLYRRAMRIVQVPLGERSYRILIGDRVIRLLGDECRKLGLGSRCAVITDSIVARHLLRSVLRSLNTAGFETHEIIVPAGETAKNLKTVASCYDKLAASRLERRSFVVALGGGVVGDVAGFVAATYLRGVPFVQVPTTLLAQVDSSVGGKVGVNLKSGKNLIGAFYQPKVVLCDVGVLRSLPEREFRAGMAEVIKYGIIYDAKLFQELERVAGSSLIRNRKQLAKIIARCCEIKAEIVGQDETESGIRAILNFGHTIGHALEAISRYGKYLHGEAISIGQVVASEISRELLGFSEEETARVKDIFRGTGLPTSVKLSSSQRLRLREVMRLDKKVQGNEIKFVLAKKIGSVVWGQKVQQESIDRALEKT